MRKVGEMTENHKTALINHVKSIQKAFGKEDILVRSKLFVSTNPYFLSCEASAHLFLEEYLKEES